MDATINALLGKVQTVSLATCEGNSPRVRPMTLIHKEGKFYFATGKSDQKSQQLDANPLAEFIFLIPTDNGTGYLRGSGIMNSITELAVRKEIADWAPFIYDYFADYADPGMMLYELKLQKLTLMQPGEMYETQVSL